MFNTGQIFTNKNVELNLVAFEDNKFTVHFVRNDLVWSEKLTQYELDCVIDVLEFKLSKNNGERIIPSNTRYKYR